MASSLKTESFSKKKLAEEFTGDLLDDGSEFEYPEYEYEPERDHLEEGEAMALYRSLKALHPNDIVHFEELSCGHYAVHLYTAEWQKQAFYRRTYEDMVRGALGKLLGPIGRIFSSK